MFNRMLVKEVVPMVPTGESMLKGVDAIQ